MITKKCITAPTFGQWALAGTVLAISASASIIALKMNWGFGIKQGSIAMATIFALGEVVVFTTPLLAPSLGGWNMRRRAAWGVALAISIFTASSELLESQAQHLISSQTSTMIASNAKADISAARAELGTISETLTTKALGDLVAEAKKKVAEREDIAKENDLVCSQQKTCATAKAEWTALVTRQGKAERRDELKAMLSRASQKVEEAPERALGAADTASALTGVDKALFASGYSLVGTALMMALLILASAFSGDAGLMLSECIRQRKEWRASQEVRITPRGMAPQAPVVVEAPEIQTEANAPQSRKDAVLLRVQMMVLHSDDRILRRGFRSLAEDFGVKRATLGDWFQDWSRKGLISYKVIGNETLISVPDTARIAA